METSTCVHAERALRAGLGADCRAPVAALAVREGDGIRLRAELISEDGRECVAGELFLTAPAEGFALARDLLDRASPSLRAHFSA